MLILIFDDKNKKSYKPSSKNDGFRILLNRLWPRGVSKEKVKLELWMKEIAPSNDLQKWFSHDPLKWKDFKRAYKKELEDKTELLNEIKDNERKHKTITLIYSAKDEEHNNAVVLKEYLERLKRKN